ncbi:PREDICTED: cytochrome P450 94B3 [Camelina sativa]|uniref:Cytochrome P450 94B3 n=1 Tax=Camelina sativa TaxID=90675 RepID=A0ABM0Y6S9_CAMSA|nr:PREDICTED: cytochrome P450 94B3 [Camelina sativa]
MEASPTLLLLLLVIVTLVLYLIVATGKYHWRNTRVPKTYPVIGCIISFYSNRNRLLDWYTELLTESPSGTVVIRRLAARRTVVTANPSNVEYILKTNFDNYPKGKPFTDILGDFLGNGIFNVDGNLWLRQRRLATHDFTPKSLRGYVTVLRNEVDNELLPFLDAAAAGVSQEQVPFDLHELLRRFFFNVVCIVFLGVDDDRCCLDPSSPVSDFDRAFQTASAVSAGRGSAPLSFVWKLKRLVGFGSEKELRNAVREVHRCVDDIIREKKKKKKKRKTTTNHEYDFLSRLIVAGESDETVRDMVISIVMAGRDTTSAVTTRLFWFITTGRMKETEHDLVNEIRSVKELTGGGLGFDYETLKKLSLLKACLCEVMRLYPPVPWDSKHALSDDRLPDGTEVRAGDRVTYFPYGMGRMEELWGEDWDDFKPNRWLVDNKTCRLVLKKVNPFMFPVFQAGPRVCLGEEMAYVQMKYVVASILDRFVIEPIPADKPVFVPMLTAHMAGGMQVRVRRRDPSRC